MDMENIESCSICMDSYDDDVRPHCLPCGHNICGTCLTNSISNGGLKCPYCQQSHVASSSNTFPINYGMEAVISQMRKSKLGAIPKDQSSSACRPLQSVGKLQEIFNDQKDRLKTLIGISDEKEVDVGNYKDFIHQRKAQHENIAKLHLEIVKQLEEEDRKLTDALMERNEHKKRATETLSNLVQVTNAIEFAVGCDEVASCCNDLEGWRKTGIQWPDVKTIRKSEKLMSHATAILKETHSEDDQDAEESPDLSNSALPIMEKLKIIRGQLSLPDLRARSESVMRLLMEGHVYGIQNKDGKIRTARISVDKNRIYLHCLKDEDLPANARTIQHSELIGSLDNSSMTTFLDLSWEGSVRGRLHILLSPDTPLARHFRLMSCGDDGSSYCHSRFHEVWNKGHDIDECVYGGDYECRDGSGGAPLMRGLNPCDEIYKRKYETGIVFTVNYGIDNSKISQFRILTGKGYNGTKSGVFGRVQEGLDIVKEAAKLDDIREVSIADCGVMLNF